MLSELSLLEHAGYVAHRDWQSSWKKAGRREPIILGDVEHHFNYLKSQLEACSQTKCICSWTQFSVQVPVHWLRAVFLKLEQREYERFFDKEHVQEQERHCTSVSGHWMSRVSGWHVCANTEYAPSVHVGGRERTWEFLVRIFASMFNGITMSTRCATRMDTSKRCRAASRITWKTSARVWERDTATC